MSDEGPTWPEGDTPGAPPPPPPPPSPQAGMPGQTVGAADIGLRIVARIIDAILLAIVNGVLGLTLFIGLRATEAGVGSAGFGMGAFGFGGSFVLGLVTTAISIGYFVLLESSWGRTLGKALLGMRTTGPAGGNPTLEEAFRRNAWMLASLLPVVGGLLQLGLAIWIIVTVSSSATNQGVHDEFAGGTQVVRA